MKAQEQPSLSNTIDAFTVADHIVRYTLVADAFIRHGMLKEVHEARLLKHIQARTDMINDLGGRIMAKAEHLPKLQREIEEALPTVKWAFRPKRTYEFQAIRNKRCQTLRHSWGSLGLELLCVDRMEGQIRLTLHRQS